MIRPKIAEFLLTDAIEPLHSLRLGKLLHSEPSCEVRNHHEGHYHQPTTYQARPQNNPNPKMTGLLNRGPADVHHERHCNECRSSDDDAPCRYSYLPKHGSLVFSKSFSW